MHVYRRRIFAVELIEVYFIFFKTYHNSKELYKKRIEKNFFSLKNSYFLKILWSNDDSIKWTDHKQLTNASSNLRSLCIHCVYSISVFSSAFVVAPISNRSTAPPTSKTIVSKSISRNFFAKLSRLHRSYETFYL